MLLHFNWFALIIVCVFWEMFSFSQKKKSITIINIFIFGTVMIPSSQPFIHPDSVSQQRWQPPNMVAEDSTIQQSHLNTNSLHLCLILPMHFVLPCLCEVLFIFIHFWAIVYIYAYLFSGMFALTLPLDYLCHSCLLWFLTLLIPDHSLNCVLDTVYLICAINHTCFYIHLLLFSLTGIIHTGLNWIEVLSRFNIWTPNNVAQFLHNITIVIGPQRSTM